MQLVLYTHCMQTRTLPAVLTPCRTTQPETSRSVKHIAMPVLIVVPGPGAHSQMEAAPVISNTRLRIQQEVALGTVLASWAAHPQLLSPQLQLRPHPQPPRRQSVRTTLCILILKGSRILSTATQTQAAPERSPHKPTLAGTIPNVRLGAISPKDVIHGYGTLTQLVVESASQNKLHSRPRSHLGPVALLLASRLASLAVQAP